MIDGIVEKGALEKKAEEVEAALVQLGMEWYCWKCKSSGPIARPERDVLAVIIDIEAAHSRVSPSCEQAAHLLAIRPRGPTVALCPFCTTGTLTLNIGYGNDSPTIKCDKCPKIWRPE